MCGSYRWCKCWVEFGAGSDELVGVLSRSAEIFYDEGEDVVGGVSVSFAECGLVCGMSVSVCTLIEGVGVDGVGGCDGDADVD